MLILILAFVALVYLVIWCMCVVGRWEDEANEELMRRLREVPDRKHAYTVSPI